MKLAIQYFILGLILLTTAPSFAATFNVTTASGGGGVPACEADPDNCDLQEALTVAAANNQDDVINLAAGSGGNYLTSNNSGSRFLYDSTEDKNLTLAGAGIGSTILDGENVSEVLDIRTTGTNATIQISGMTLQNAVDSGAGIAGGLFILNANGNIDIDTCEFLDNKHDGTAAGASITSAGDLTITNSLFTSNVFQTAGSSGGALFLLIGGDTTFNNNTLDKNAGDASVGGLYISCGGNLTVSENTFTENTSEDLNGAILVSVGVGFTLDANIFSKNTGLQGVGNFAIGSVANFTNNSFDQNTATDGSLILASVGSDLGFDNNIFTQNEAKQVAGVFLSVGGIGTFTQNTFSGNTSENNVGAVFLTIGGNLIFNNGTIIDNTGRLQGGANFNVGGTVTLINNIIAGNTSTDTSAVDGAGISMLSALPINIINNTIVDNISNNTAGFGGGLWIGMQSGAADTHIYNNILFGNSGLTAGNGQDLFVDNSAAAGAMMNLFNNDFSEICFDNGGAPTCDLGSVTDLNSGDNITAPGLDPLFIDAAGGNFQLGAGSPVVDQGTSTAPDLPSTDRDGNPRVVGGEVDMGALEAQANIAVNPTSLDFGTIDVDQDDTKILTLSNEGSVLLTVDGMTLSDTQNYSLDLDRGNNPCGSRSFTLNFGENCTIGVVFSPSSDGSFDATLTISSDDPDEGELVVAITGVGQFPNGGGGCSLESVAPPMNALALLLIPFSLMLVRFRLR